MKISKVSKENEVEFPLIFYGWEISVGLKNVLKNLVVKVT